MGTRRERVFATLRGEATDRPPKGELYMFDGTVEKFGLSSREELADLLNMDILSLNITDHPDWQYYRKKDFFTVGLYQGPFTFIFNSLSIKDLSNLVIKNPEEAERLMREDIIKSKPALFQALADGCDAVLLEDDMAGRGGPLVSPRFLEKHYFPVVRDLIAEIRSQGFNVPVLFHSDGNVTLLLTGLKEAGFNGLQCLEPSAGMLPVLFAYGGFEGWLFWGNYEFEDNDKLKSPTTVAMEIPQLLYRWQDIGGYIFGSTGGLYDTLDPQAIIAAYKMVDKGYRVDG